MSDNSGKLIQRTLHSLRELDLSVLGSDRRTPDKPDGTPAPSRPRPQPNLAFTGSLPDARPPAPVIESKASSSQPSFPLADGPAEWTDPQNQDLVAAQALLDEALRKEASVTEREEKLRLERSIFEREIEQHQKRVADFENSKRPQDTREGTCERCVEKLAEISAVAEGYQLELRKQREELKDHQRVFTETLEDLESCQKSSRELIASRDLRISNLSSRLALSETALKKMKTADSELKATKKQLRQLKKEIEQVNTPNKTHREILKETGPFQITDEDVIRWLASDNCDDLFRMPSYATMIGEGPISWNQMLTHLVDWNCEPYLNGCEWIIVGRDEWTPEALDMLIAERGGEDIKIVSQELFIAAAISGHDPFMADHEILLAFAKDHPALEYLLAAGFEWPFIGDWLSDDPPGFQSMGADRSPLKKMGYTVGVSGLDENDRRTILADAFQGELPWVESDEYMDLWGCARSRHRLHRMAHHIARRIPMHRGILNHDVAVSDWAKDLDWLYQKFYQPWMRFNWPEVSVD